MKKNFVLSSWQGYEIDSSEFAAAFEVKDVPRTIKTFIESPFIRKQFSCSNIFKILLNAIDIANLENKERVESIVLKNKTINQMIEYHLKNILGLLELSRRVDRTNRRTLEIKESTSEEGKNRFSDSLDISNKTFYDFVDITRTDIPETFVNLEELNRLIKTTKARDSFYSLNPYADALQKYERAWINQDNLLELSIFLIK